MYYDKRAPLDVDPAGVLSAKDASRPRGFRGGKASKKEEQQKIRLVMVSHLLLLLMQIPLEQ